MAEPLVAKLVVRARAAAWVARKVVSKAAVGAVVQMMRVMLALMALMALMAGAEAVLFAEQKRALREDILRRAAAVRVVTMKV